MNRLNFLKSLAALALAPLLCGLVAEIPVEPKRKEESSEYFQFYQEELREGNAAVFDDIEKRFIFGW